MKKNILQSPWFITILVALVVGGASFYSGLLLGKSKQIGRNGQTGPAGQFGQGGGPNRRVQVGSMINGTILSKDDKSLTIKTPNGGSKIVFFATSTKILKSVEGSVADLQVNSNVITSGQVNADGSVTAQMIQLRQDLMGPGGPGANGQPGRQAPDQPKPLDDGQDVK